MALSDIPILRCPTIDSRVSVFHSAKSKFHAPCDPSGIAGMRTEMIRCNPTWQNQGTGRFDCAFVVTDQDVKGFRGLAVARIRLLFSFVHDDVTYYPCALVHWFTRVADTPDDDTGMWVVKKKKQRNGKPHSAVIHLDSILRAAHLVPVYGKKHLGAWLPYEKTLDDFDTFYVNKFIDHHANEIAF